MERVAPDCSIATPITVPKSINTEDIATEEKIKKIIENYSDVKKVGVIGLGYVGATLAITLANRGHRVVGLEHRTSLVETLKMGQLGFFEENGNDLLKQALESGRLAIHEDYQCDDLDVIFITVGTPLDKSNNPDNSYLQKALDKAFKILSFGGLICLRSTVQVGTCTSILNRYLQSALSEFP